MRCGTRKVQNYKSTFSRLKTGQKISSAAFTTGQILLFIVYFYCLFFILNWTEDLLGCLHHRSDFTTGTSISDFTTGDFTTGAISVILPLVMLLPVMLLLVILLLVILLLVLVMVLFRGLTRRFALASGLDFTTGSV